MEATALHHSKKSDGLKSSWCTSNPISLFGFPNLKINFTSFYVPFMIQWNGNSLESPCETSPGIFKWITFPFPFQHSIQTTLRPTPHNNPHLDVAGAKQPAHWFLGGRDLDIQQVGMKCTLFVEVGVVDLNLQTPRGSKNVIPLKIWMEPPPVGLEVYLPRRG